MFLSHVVPVCSISGAHGLPEFGDCGAGAPCTVTGPISCAGVTHFLFALPGFSAVLQPAAAQRGSGQEEQQEEQLRHGSAATHQRGLNGFMCLECSYSPEGFKCAHVFGVQLLTRRGLNGFMCSCLKV